MADIHKLVNNNLESHSEPIEVSEHAVITNIL